MSYFTRNTKNTLTKKTCVMFESLKMHNDVLKPINYK